MVKKILFLSLSSVGSLYAMEQSTLSSNSEILEQTAREFYPDDTEKQKSFITEGLKNWIESRYTHQTFNKEEYLNPSSNSFGVLRND